MKRKDMEQKRILDNQKSFNDIYKFLSLELAKEKIRVENIVCSELDMYCLAGLIKHGLIERHNREYGIDVKEFGI